MRILIIGANGKVGNALATRLANHQLHLVGGREDIDVSDLNRLSTLISSLRPAVIINATAMNGMENCANDPVGALMVNAAAPTAMAQLAARNDALFIHFSTDYVLTADDETGMTEDRRPEPWGMYGISKLAGEAGVAAAGGNSIVLRLSSIYGPEPSGPTEVLNQVKRGKGTETNPVEVLHQFCAPTSAAFVAEAVAHIVETVPWGRFAEVVGLYHLTTSKGVWKTDFARYLLGKDVVVTEGVLRERRPVYSFMSSSKFERVFNFPIIDPYMDDSYGHLNAAMTRLEKTS